MRTAGTGPDGVRLRALVVLVCRAGFRIGKALAIAETELDSRRKALLIRHGNNESATRSRWTAGRRSSPNPGSSSAATFA